MLRSRHVVLRQEVWPDIQLRSIRPSDMETLRRWKNAHREGFFFQGCISPEQQRAWFAGYCTRANDTMFIVEDQAGALGTMGIRPDSRNMDIYNVIRGASRPTRNGEMSRAIRLLALYAQRCGAEAVLVRVRLDNPAVRWYVNNGFRLSVTRGDHVIMQWEPPADAQHTEGFLIEEVGHEL